MKLSPGFRARARERRAAAVAKLKASRLKGSTNARATSSAATNDGALAGSAGPETGVDTPTPRPNVVVDGIDARISVPRVGSAPRVPAFLTPAKTATVSEEANRASPKRDVVSASSPRRSRSPDGRSSPETPFAFRVEDGSPPARLPATPSTFGSRASSARKSPAESSVEGAEFGSLRPRSGSPRSRSPRVPTPLAEAPPWSSSKSLGSPSLASPTGSARSRSPRSPAGVSSVPASARATLRMNKNAPSLSFSPGSAGSPSPGAGCSPSDGYPYTKFVLGPAGADRTHHRRGAGQDLVPDVPRERNRGRRRAPLLRREQAPEQHRPGRPRGAGRGAQTQRNRNRSRSRRRVPGRALAAVPRESRADARRPGGVAFFSRRIGASDP